MYEAVFLEHRGVASRKAGWSPPIVSGDWSAVQNENKYSQGSEPVSLVKGVWLVYGLVKCRVIRTLSAS